jgi:hypothetical protein
VNWRDGRQLPTVAVARQTLLADNRQRQEWADLDMMGFVADKHMVGEVEETLRHLTPLNTEQTMDHFCSRKMAQDP